MTCLKDSLAICIPVANEEKTIHHFLINIQKVIDELIYECPKIRVFIIMDNYSRDNTYNIVNQFSKEDDRFELLFFQKSTGVVSCYLYGEKTAIARGFEFIVEMDSGGSHPPEHIPEIYKGLSVQGKDFIYMSRFFEDGSFENVPSYRKMVSLLANLSAKYCLGLPYSDSVGGYKGMRRSSLQKIIDHSYASSSVWQIQFKYNSYGFSYGEIPYKYVGSSTTFRLSWVVEGIKIVLKMWLKKS